MVVIGVWLTLYVLSGEQVQSDGVALISAVRSLFPVLRKEGGVVVGKHDGSSSHQRICDTLFGFSHSVVQV